MQIKCTVGIQKLDLQKVQILKDSRFQKVIFLDKQNYLISEKTNSAKDVKLSITAGIWNVTIQYPDFLNWISNGPVFKGSGYIYIYGPTHSKSGHFCPVFE